MSKSNKAFLFAPLKLYERDTFVDLVKSAPAAPPTDCVLRKQFAAAIDTKSIDDQTRTVKFVISAETPDRDKDVIAVAGWKLDNYRKNPVVQWAHDYYSLPVGKAVMVGTDRDVLISSAQFASKDLYEFADTVYQMLKQGFLNAVSVGFRPMKFMYNAERSGMDFAEQELLEYSIVPVPAHPEALIMARGAGIDLEPLKKWAEKALDEYHGESGLYLPKAKIEEVFKMLNTRTIIVLNGQGQNEKGEPACPRDSACPATPYGAVESCSAEDCPLRGENHDTPMPSNPGDVTHALETACTKHGVSKETVLLIADDLKGVLLMLKRGRMLSKANEDKLREACASIEQAAGNLKDVLDKLPTPATNDEDEDQCDAGKRAGEIVLEILEDDPITDKSGELIIVDEETLKAAVEAAMGKISSELKAVVSKEATAALNNLKGRINDK